MAIRIHHRPSAVTAGNVAYQAGLGQYRQHQQQVGQRQQQLDQGQQRINAQRSATALRAEAERRRMAAGIFQQQQGIAADERRMMFGAYQRQRKQQAGFENQEAEFDRESEFARERSAEQHQRALLMEEARQKGRIDFAQFEMDEAATQAVQKFEKQRKLIREHDGLSEAEKQQHLEDIDAQEAGFAQGLRPKQKPQDVIDNLPTREMGGEEVPMTTDAHGNPQIMSGYTGHRKLQIEQEEQAEVKRISLLPYKERWQADPEWRAEQLEDIEEKLEKQRQEAFDKDDITTDSNPKPVTTADIIAERNRRATLGVWEEVEEVPVRQMEAELTRQRQMAQGLQSVGDVPQGMPPVAPDPELDPTGGGVFAGATQPGEEAGFAGVESQSGPQGEPQQQPEPQPVSIKNVVDTQSAEALHTELWGDGIPGAGNEGREPTRAENLVLKRMESNSERIKGVSVVVLSRNKKWQIQEWAIMPPGTPYRLPDETFVRWRSRRTED